MHLSAKPEPHTQGFTKDVKSQTRELTESWEAKSLVYGSVCFLGLSGPSLFLENPKKEGRRPRALLPSFLLPLLFGSHHPAWQGSPTCTCQSQKQSFTSNSGVCSQSKQKFNLRQGGLLPKPPPATVQLNACSGSAKNFEAAMENHLKTRQKPKLTIKKINPLKS